MNLKQHYETLLVKHIKQAERALYENSKPAFSRNEDYEFKLPSWMRSSLTLIEEIMDRESIYYIHFKELFDSDEDNEDVTAQGMSILEDVRDVIKKQELLKAQVLIETEIFTDLLTQADYLLGKNYKDPAAVIVGCVMEDALLKIIQRRGIVLSEKEKSMQIYNDRLGKKENGVYSDLIKSKIDFVIKLRNHAAHAEWKQFDSMDVTTAIGITRRFLSEDYSNSP